MTLPLGFPDPDRAGFDELPPELTEQWWERPLLTLDYETTGVEILTARPLSMACVWLQPPGLVGDGWSGYVDPGAEVGSVPDEVVKIHGITLEKARGGTPWRQAAEYVCSQVEKAIAEDCAVVIFNAPYDWPLACMEWERAGRQRPQLPGIVDPLVLDRKFQKYRKGKKTMDLVARAWGVTPGDEHFHDARSDAVVAGQIAYRMGEKTRELDVPLGTLLALQARWHEDWRVDFNAWLVRQATGKPPVAKLRWPWGPLDPDSQSPVPSGRQWLSIQPGLAVSYDENDRRTVVKEPYGPEPKLAPGNFNPIDDPYMLRRDDDRLAQSSGAAGGAEGQSPALGNPGTGVLRDGPEGPAESGEDGRSGG